MSANELWVLLRVEGISLREYHKYIGEIVAADTACARKKRKVTFPQVEIT